MIYNAPFDLSLLPPSTRALVVLKARCAMQAMATWRAWRAASLGTPRWCTLAVAAAVAGHAWERGPHSALADADALRSVWRFLAAQVSASTEMLG